MSLSLRAADESAAPLALAEPASVVAHALLEDERRAQTDALAAAEARTAGVAEELAELRGDAPSERSRAATAASAALEYATRDAWQAIWVRVLLLWVAISGALGLPAALLGRWALAWAGGLAAALLVVRWATRQRARWRPLRRARTLIGALGDVTRIERTLALLLAVALVAALAAGAPPRVFALVSLAALAAGAVYVVLRGRADLLLFRLRHAPQPQRWVMTDVSHAPGVPTRFVAVAVDGRPARVELTSTATSLRFGLFLEIGDVLVSIFPGDGDVHAFYLLKAGIACWGDFDESGFAAGLGQRWMAELRGWPDPLRQLAAAAEPAAELLREECELGAAMARHREALARLDRQAAVWDDLFLPTEVAHALIAALDLVRRRDAAAPRGILLAGPARSGRSTIAQRAAAFLGGPCIPVGPADLSAPDAPARVGALWAAAREHAPAVLLVEDCDAVFHADAGAGVAAFLAQWTTEAWRDRVLMIGTATRIDRIDPAAMARFGEVVELPLPDALARAAILDRAIAGAGLGLSISPALVEGSDGLTGGDLVAIARAARRDAVVDGVRPSESHLHAALAAVRRSGAPDSPDDGGWDRLVLPQRAAERLQAIAGMLRNAELIRQQGLALPRALLLHGPPGTGKTEVVRALAGASGLHVEALAPDEAAADPAARATAVRATFERARAAAPAIVYVDQLDALAPAPRSGEDADGELGRAIDEVLRDEQPVFVAAAASRLDALDPAMRARFPATIELALPEHDARMRILERLLRDRVTAPDAAAALPAIASATAGWSGRDLRALIERAEQRAGRRASGHGGAAVIGGDDLTTALGQH